MHQTPAEMLRSARRRRDLSQRALAKLAGVSHSTISRVEDGSLDPGYTTMLHVLEAAGVTSRTESLPALSDLESVIDENPVRTEWHRIRGLLDEMGRHPRAAAVVIARGPARSEGFPANLLAGIAEKIADDANIERPSWTRSIRPLVEPWDPPAPARARKRARNESPAQLRARNIYIAASDLWRHA